VDWNAVSAGLSCFKLMGLRDPPSGHLLTAVLEIFILYAGYPCSCFFSLFRSIGGSAAFVLPDFVMGFMISYFLWVSLCFCLLKGAVFFFLSI